MIIKKRDRKSASHKKKGQSGREYGDGALQRSRRRDMTSLLVFLPQPLCPQIPHSCQSHLLQASLRLHYFPSQSPVPMPDAAPN